MLFVMLFGLFTFVACTVIGVLIYMNFNKGSSTEESSTEESSTEEYVETSSNASEGTPITDSETTPATDLNGEIGTKPGGWNPNCANTGVNCQCFDEGKTYGCRECPKYTQHLPNECPGYVPPTDTPGGWNIGCGHYGNVGVSCQCFHEGSTEHGCRACPAGTLLPKACPQHAYAPDSG